MSDTGNRRPMLLYNRPGHSCLIVGRGLVGSAVGRALAQSGWNHAGEVKPDWTDPCQLAAAAAALLDRAASDARRSIIWAAGRCGFGASETDTTSELDFYRTTLAELAKTHRRQTTLHVVSSAGALHEGGRDVADGATFTGGRPYAKLKLAQEEAAMSLFDSWCIVRVSTAFGHRSTPMRRGLVTALMENGATNQATRLVGSPSTLRDYVYTDDIGDGLVTLVESTATGVHYFISGRPTSIHEVTLTVEQVLGRRLNIHYGPASNDADITFSPTLRSTAFKPRTLKVAVAQLALTRATP